MYVCESKGAGEESTEAGEKQSQAEQGSRGTETKGCDLSVADPFINRWGSTENTTDLCPHGLSSAGSSLLGPTAVYPAAVTPGMGGHGPLCPCLRRCGHRPRGGLHPSATQGNVSSPWQERVPLGPTGEAHLPSRCGRRQCSQALPGSGDLLRLCQGRILQKTCVGQQTLLSGKEQLGETSCGQSEAGREQRTEKGSQRQVCRVEDPEKTEQPKLAVREAEDRGFPEEAAESLLTCR